MSALSWAPARLPSLSRFGQLPKIRSIDFQAHSAYPCGTFGRLAPPPNPTPTINNVTRSPVRLEFHPAYTRLPLIPKSHLRENKKYILRKETSWAQQTSHKVTYHTHRPIESDPAQPKKAAMAPPNKDLTGHRLLIIIPWPIPETYLDGLKSRYPGLEIQFCQFPVWETWKLPGSEVISDEDWRKTTILVPGPVGPTPEQAPNLKLLQLMSAGADLFTNKPLFLDNKDLRLCTANGTHGPQIAEWVVMTYLAYQRKLPSYLKKQEQGIWNRDSAIAPDSFGQCVGILGYGSIGRQTARLATALGMTIHAFTHSPRPTAASRRDRAYVTPGLGDPEGTLPSKWFSSADEGGLKAFLTSGIDLLVVATPLTPETRGLLGREEFRLLASSGKKAFLSNIARGAVVDTDALVEALEDGTLRGAALDVTDPEPLPQGHKLWGMGMGDGEEGKVIITPHMSGATDGYMKRFLGILQANLEALAEGKEEDDGWMNLVDRSKGY